MYARLLDESLCQVGAAHNWLRAHCVDSGAVVELEDARYFRQRRTSAVRRRRDHGRTCAWRYEAYVSGSDLALT